MDQEGGEAFPPGDPPARSTGLRHLASRDSRAVLAYLIVGSCLICGYFAVPLHSSSGELDLKVAFYVAVNASATVALAVGIWWYRPKAPVAWLLLVLNQLIYTAGDVAFYIRADLWKRTNFPSISDALYLGHYLPLIAALVIVVRRRRAGHDRAAALEGSILACGLGLLMWIFLIAPQVHAVGETPLAKLVSVMYPMMDVIVLALAMRMIVDSGRRSVAYVLLVVALLLLLSTDAVYGVQQLDGTFISGSFLDGLWAGYYLLIGAMALHPSMRDLAQPGRELPASSGRGRLVALALASLMAPASLLIQYERHAPLDIEVLAGGAAAMFLLVIARMWLLVVAQETASVTDSLTRLHNRRFFEEQLALEGARQARSKRTLAMFMLDIDHFKLVNDDYGHPAGDRVLREVAQRIRLASREGDIVARIGGEEFAVLASDLQETSLAPLAERLRLAVTGQSVEVAPGRLIKVTVSIGVAAMPLHASTTAELVTLADRALYGAKQAGRDRTLIGTTQMPAPHLLVRSLETDSKMIDYLSCLEDEVEGYRAPDEHSSAIGRWAGVLAVHTGLDSDAQARCEIAGRLHDIGKLIVPPEILAKLGPLTKEEWLIVRLHAQQGANLLSAFGAGQATAQVVGQHHERFDGSGYPIGLKGDEIRVEARIIAICDTWAAMRVERPGRAASPFESALDELRRCRSSQFDPDLLDLFIDLVGRGMVGELGRPHRFVPV